jgi:hypothetical protein
LQCSWVIYQVLLELLEHSEAVWALHKTRWTLDEKARVSAF